MTSAHNAIKFQASDLNHSGGEYRAGETDQRIQVPELEGVVAVESTDGLGVAVKQSVSKLPRCQDLIALHFPAAQSQWQKVPMRPLTRAQFLPIVFVEIKALIVPALLPVRF